MRTLRGRKGNPREAIPEATVAKESMINRARDELFSHINRCGVLQAEEDDQRHWMDETIDYLAERYPDLSDKDLQDLYSVGIRFCQPAIPHGRKRYGFDKDDSPENGSAESTPDTDPTTGENLVAQEVGGENSVQNN
jgi:hypothetical protein